MKRTAQIAPLRRRTAIDSIDCCGIRREEIRPNDQTEQVVQPQWRRNNNLFFVREVGTNGRA